MILIALVVLVIGEENRAGRAGKRGLRRQRNRHPQESQNGDKEKGIPHRFQAPRKGRRAIEADDVHSDTSRPSAQSSHRVPIDAGRLGRQLEALKRDPNSNQTEITLLEEQLAQLSGRDLRSPDAQTSFRRRLKKPANPGARALKVLYLILVIALFAWAISLFNAHLGRQRNKKRR
jgi:hypothetical protein